MAIKVNQENFVLAQNAAVVLHAGKTTEAIIRGLQGMGLCLGFEMETTQVREMGRRIALTVPSGGSFTAATANYNFIPGDTVFEELRDAAINSTLITDMRLYTKRGCDFSAADLISDSESGIYIGSITDPSVDSPSSLFTGSLTYMPGGPFVLFVAHTAVGEGTNLSYVASTRTLTLAGGDDFETDYGFEAGDTCILDYADSMDPQYVQISTVTSTTIVFTDAVGDVASIGDFSGIATTQLHGATPLVVSGVTGVC